jgi:eukaryotic-like serine/threonine-protein kinase
LESSTSFNQALSGKVCLQCGRGFPDDHTVCPSDGSELSQRKETQLVGTRIAEHYKIMSLIGMGGMSAVYKAKHELLEKIVAIKLLHQHLVSQVGTLKRFQQEAKAISHLSHPNIVGVHEFGLLNEGQAYLIMDYLEGESLSDRLRNAGPMSCDQAVQVYVQICAALEHAHEKGIIHRDLKPSNVMLVRKDGSDDYVKLVDFGIAKLMPHAELEGQRLTQTGEVFGSPVYMSPEQCMGQPLDVRSDIYSMGCVMYETLAGQPPYIGQNIMETMYMRLSEKPPPFVPELRVPPQLEEIIMVTLSQEPGDRYQTMKDLREELHLAMAAPGKRTWTLIPSMRRTVRTKNLLKKKRSVRDEIVWATAAVAISTSALIIWGETTHLWPWQSKQVNPETNWRKHQLAAQKLFDQGNYAESERAYKLAVSEAEKFGEHDRRFQNTLMKLAKVYQVEGKEEEFKQASSRLDAVEEQNGESDTAANDDGNLSEMADLTLTLAPKVVQKDKWPEYQKLTDKLTKLATLCQEKQNYKKAEQLMEKALDIEIAALGTDSPNTARTMVSMADLYMEVGKFGDAQLLYERALQSREKSLGANHPEVAATLCRLAIVFEQEGKYDKSEEYFKKAITLYESAYGTSDPQLASALDGLGGLYRMQSKFSQAEELFIRALNIYEKTQGKNHETVGIACNNLAGLYFARGQYDKAEPMYRRSLAIYEKLYGAEDPTVATILNNLAAVFFKENKLDKAEPLLRRALAIRERVLPEDHPQIAQSMNALAELYRREGKFADAKPLYEEALTITEATFGVKHPEVATILSSLGELAYDQGRYREAEDFFKVALQIRENSYKGENADVASSLNQLAMSYLKQSRYQDAEPLFKRALAIREKLFGKNSPMVGETLDGYGDLLFSTNRLSEGFNDKSQALSIWVQSNWPKFH